MIEELKSWEKPNGFVVRGPSGSPALVAYKEDGTIENGATELSIMSWLKSVMKPDRTFPEDTLILVHVVEGDGTMLIKSLEVNKLTWFNEPTTAAEVVRMGAMESLAQKLRDRFIEKELAKKPAIGGDGDGDKEMVGADCSCASGSDSGHKHCRGK